LFPKLKPVKIATATSRAIVKINFKTIKKIIAKYRKKFKARFDAHFP